MIGVLKVARGFFAAHSRCTTETIANCLCVSPQVFRRIGAGQNIGSVQIPFNI